MPDVVPELSQRRWDSLGARRLGVRPDAVSSGFGRFIVEQPYGDARDADELFTNLALTYALDVAALAAVLARVEQEGQQPNGTASLHINFLQPPAGAMRAEAQVVYWSEYDSVLELQTHDAGDRLVARGLCSYSLRPKNGGAPPGVQQGRQEQPVAEAPADPPLQPPGPPPGPGAGRAELASYFEGTPAFRELGARVAAAEDGQARLLVARSAVRLRGVRDSINGGVVASLAEAAMQVALASVLREGERAGRTQELSVAYLSGARGEETAIEARMLRKGRRLAVGEVDVRDAGDGTHNTRVRVSCEVLPAS